MQLFELTNILFSSPDKWKSVTRGDKKQNYFMINRMMSIQYPLQAQALNLLKMDPVAAVDFWQNFMSKLYHRTPGWMYTKGQKKQKQAKENKALVKMSVLIDYARTFTLDLKSVKDALEFFPEEMLKELNKFEKIKNG